LQQNVVVADLIVKQHGVWKEDLLKLLYDHNDVKEILAIPLSKNALRDKIQQKNKIK
jgi:hypothetical protein